jgi:aminoglycoside 6'-N-acetyltransferase I
METLTIQQAGLETKEEALALLRRFFADEGFPVAPEELAWRLEVMLTSTERVAVFLAWQDEQPVGAATVTISFGLEFGYSAELEDLYVLPEARGRGVAQALMEAAQAWSRSHQCVVLMAVVTPEDQVSRSLQHFYLARGFRLSGRMPLFFDL